MNGWPIHRSACCETCGIVAFVTQETDPWERLCGDCSDRAKSL